MADFTGTLLEWLAGAEILNTDTDNWHDILDALTSGFTDVSSTTLWTGATTNPVLGNGTKTAFAKQIGKLGLFAFNITMGSTTTFGSGQWQVSTPWTLANSGLFACASLTLDADTAANRKPAVLIASGANLIGYAAAGNLILATNPFTWTTSDSWRGFAVGEIA